MNVTELIELKNMLQGIQCIDEDDVRFVELTKAINVNATVLDRLIDMMIAEGQKVREYE